MVTGRSRWRHRPRLADASPMTTLALLDAAGRRRSPATMPGYRHGRGARAPARATSAARSAWRRGFDAGSSCQSAHCCASSPGPPAAGRGRARRRERRSGGWPQMPARGGALRRISCGARTQSRWRVSGPDGWRPLHSRVAYPGRDRNFDRWCGHEPSRAALGRARAQTIAARPLPAVVRARNWTGVVSGRPSGAAAAGSAPPRRGS